MAKLGGLNPLFTQQGLKGYLKDKAENYEQNVLDTLLFQGEEFINRARSVDTYTARTGNLRASIGYIVLHNGKRVGGRMLTAPRGTDRETGKKTGEDFISELSGLYPQGYVLIGVAGMHYAAAVEAKGYDVISGSAPNDNRVISILREINS